MGTLSAQLSKIAGFGGRYARLDNRDFTFGDKNIELGISHIFYPTFQLGVTKESKETHQSFTDIIAKVK